jgi:hypothetical protein
MLTASQNAKIDRNAKAGQKFNRWTLIEKSTEEKDCWGKYKWWAKCDCGTIRPISLKLARRGETKSCGCISKERKGTALHRTRAFVTLKGMVQRCTNPNNPNYKYYGAKGVFVCDRWRGVGGVKRFVEDMGHPPEGKGIDRINPFDGYHPGNCRWVTPAENNRNQRKHYLKNTNNLTKDEQDLLG